MNELWVEKYRPHKIADCILPHRLKSVFQEYVNSGSISNMLLTGTAGVGKTTVAKAMCEEIGLNHLFINSSEERGIETLRTKIKQYASTVSLTGGRKVIILDEADYLTPEAQAALRGAIEEFSDNCTFIFTCNFKNRLISAIHSRCTVIDFHLAKEEKSEMAVGMYHRCVEILETEGIEYDRKVLPKVVKKYFPDYRRTINELQRFCASGILDTAVISQLEDAGDLGILIASLRDKDWSTMRKWCASNSDVDPGLIFRKRYEHMSDVLKPHSVPQAVVIIGKYQYQAAFVADQEINMVAMLTELMIECEYI